MDIDNIIKSLDFNTQNAGELHQSISICAVHSPLFLILICSCRGHCDNCLSNQTIIY